MVPNDAADKYMLFRTRAVLRRHANGAKPVEEEAVIVQSAAVLDAGDSHIWFL